MAVEGPSQGLNLGNAPSPYSDSFITLDLMSGAEPWAYYDGSQGVTLTPEQLPLDEDGWPMALPVIDGVQTEIYSNVFYGNIMPAGQYILEWDGTGDLIVFDDYEVIGENRILITFGPEYLDANGDPAQDGITVLISSNDPLGTGDYVHDIRLYRAEYADLVASGEVFDPDWYNAVDDFRILRTHDWQYTNAATAVEWDQTVFDADRAIWGLEGYGMPWELLVDIANETRSDLWVTIPHTASDDYIRAAGAFLRDNVDPDLQIHVEFSNEYFTTIFDQYDYFQSGGAALGEVDYGAGQFYGTEAAAMAAILEEVFAGEEDRLRTVVTVDSAMFQTGEARLVLTSPDAGGAASPLDAGIEVLATNGYLHWYAHNIADEIAAWMAEPDGGFGIAADYLLEQLDTVLIPHWEAGRALADEFGLDFMIYEGGLLLLNDVDYAAADPVLTDFATAFAVSDEAALVYEAMAAAWAQIGTGPFVWYSDTGRPGPWGSYGHFDAVTFDPTPRGAVVVDANSTVAPWWTGDDRAAATFDNPLYLAGSAEWDRMTGSAGADRLYGLEGRDWLHGGLGDDELWAGGGDDRIAAATGADEIHGGLGRDVISGGPGDDAFVFDSPDEGGDLIADFSNGGPWGDDAFWLLASAFGAAGPGALPAEAFQAAAGAEALTAATRIIYDTEDGHLYFDADGAGGEAAVLLAVLLPWSAAPEAADFVFY